MAFAKFLNSAEKKLREIRRSNDAVKNRWLYGLSAISMIFVVGFWVLYLNAGIPRIGEEKKIVLNKESKPSFLETFGRGFKIVALNIENVALNLGRQIGAELKKVKNRTQESKEFSLSGASVNFTYKNLDPVPKTHLP